MHRPASRRAPWRRLLAVLAVASVVAAGCGGDDDDDEGGGTDTTEDSSGGASETTAPPEDEGEPVDGGTLVYGLEADSSTPWTPQNTVCAISCHMIMRTVYDTLTLPAEDGTYKPYLAESVEHNDDYTEWTITPRQGVTFHDGTPFDAAAICANLTAHLTSILTGKALLNVDGGPDDPDGPGPTVNADGTACVVPMKEAWTHFDAYLSAQIGYMASPAYLAAAADPETGAAAAAEPVGTGPFVFESYEPGGSFIATKNPNYWRASEGLPHLDRVEMRVFVDVQSRVNALLDGTVDMIHLSNGEFIASLRDEDSIEMEETDTYGETGYLLLNNRDPVIQDIRVRRALALATDNESISRDREGGVEPVANGPFSPSQVGYLEDTGYPTYDLEAAIALVEEYEAENGPLEIKFDTTNDPYNAETNQFIAASWEAAGIDVTINTVEQGSFIVNALTGNFQVFGWRNHGGVDPDSQRVWWHSETGVLSESSPLALNFGGIDDPDIDAQLEIIRTSADEDERKAAAEEINRIFGEQVYNIWNTWTVWGLAHKPSVHGIDAFTFPDGSGTLPGAGIAGTHQIVQMWIDG